MKKIVLAVLAMVCVSAVGCNEESAGRPSAFNNAAKAPHPTSYKSILSEGKKDTARITGSDAKNILATKPIKTPAMKDRDCAIIYDTAGVHDQKFQEYHDAFDAKVAISNYQLLLEECPDSPHAEQARLAVKDLGAQIKK